MSRRWQVAQTNVGRSVAPYGTALPKINALADAQTGFVRRLTGEGDDASAYLALGWVRGGYRPTPAEGRERLQALRRNGPTPFAFSLRQPFAAPGGAEQAPILDECA